MDTLRNFDPMDPGKQIDLRGTFAFEGDKNLCVRHAAEDGETVRMSGNPEDCLMIWDVTPETLFYRDAFPI